MAKVTDVLQKEGVFKSKKPAISPQQLLEDMQKFLPVLQEKLKDRDSKVAQNPTDKAAISKYAECFEEVKSHQAAIRKLATDVAAREPEVKVYSQDATSICRH